MVCRDAIPNRSSQLGALDRVHGRLSSRSSVENCGQSASEAGGCTGRLDPAVMLGTRVDTEDHATSCTSCVRAKRAFVVIPPAWASRDFEDDLAELISSFHADV